MTLFSPRGGSGCARNATIDEHQPNNARQAAELDRLRRELRQARADAATAQRRFAETARELALVYESRSWRVAEWLRRSFGARRRPARVLPTVPAEAGTSRPRALFADGQVPTPDRDAASVDMECYLRIFLGLGYDVTLLPVADLTRADAYVERLRQLGVRVIAGGRYASAEDFLAAETAPFDLMLLYRASLAAGKLPAQLRAHSPQARLVFNTTDLHFLRLEREAELHRSAAIRDEAARVREIELAMIARADWTILLSPVEQRLIAGLLPYAGTSVIPIARAATGRTAPFAPRRGVLFIGGFRHRPNVDAAVTFVAETWPLIRARLGISFGIVGADPPEEVWALANPAAGIAVLGHVPDLDAALAACRLTVAPLRFGAGTKGKIVGSLAAGVPCVASPVAAEGMGLRDGETIRVAATPEAFADAVIEVHEREDVWTSLSDAGVAFARDAFSVETARAGLRAMLRELGRPAGPDSA